jgi:hypothetical protein
MHHLLHHAQRHQGSGDGRQEHNAGRHAIYPRGLPVPSPFGRGLG